MGFWADTFGGGNSFTESVANTFTRDDGASYVSGNLVYDSGSNKGTAVAANTGGGYGGTNSDGTPVYSGGGQSDGTGFVVQPGQTLSEIAADTGTSVEQLMSLNNITDPNKIQSGAALKTVGSFFGEDGISIFDKDKTSAPTVKGEAPEAGLMSFSLPRIISSFAGWVNGTDPSKDTPQKYGDRMVYTKKDAEGNVEIQYSHNALGMQYEVKVIDGKVVDALSLDANGNVPGSDGYDRSTTKYEINRQSALASGDNDGADEIASYQANNASNATSTYSSGGSAGTGGSSGAGSAGSDIVMKMAQDAGMAGSNEDIQAILNDPGAWLKANGAILSGRVPGLDAEAIGSLLDPTNANYILGADPAVEVATAGDPSAVAAVDNPGVETYDASTATDLLGTDATTVNPATGEIRDENLVDAAQIDMKGAATGVNADGTTSVTGEALNDFATQNISTMIDTSTVSGKLLAQKLGEGNYTDSKATILGQMEIISAEFKNSNGDPVVPPWAQSLARSVSKTMAFSGITGTAQIAAMSNAIMEATLGVAEKEAVFFQTITTKNLDNRQQAIINKASVLAKFEVANLDARQAAAVQNAKSFLEMDLTNLTNEQQSEVVNTQAMVDAIFNDQSAINSARLFGAEQSNDMAKYYDNMNAQISLQNSEQLNQMKKFNAGEINDGREFNARLEESRQEFYANMQYNLDLANAKWRQTVATANTEMEFEAATTDVSNILDLSSEAMTRVWDRVDNTLDYIFKGWNAEADRDAAILGSEIRAQSGQTSGSTGDTILSGLFTLGAAWIASSDERLKQNIEYYDTFKGVKYYTWEWNDVAKQVGADKYPCFGVIAQQVRKKHPNAVSVGENGYLMVNYGEIQ